MKVTFGLGRRVFAVGRIFDRYAGQPVRWVKLYPGRLLCVQFGKWGLAVINFAAR